FSLHSAFSFYSTYLPPTEIYPLSLHDALPISLITIPMSCVKSASDERTFSTGLIVARSGFVAQIAQSVQLVPGKQRISPELRHRSEEHTSELQSLRHLVCRLLLEKKKKKQIT